MKSQLEFLWLLLLATAMVKQMITRLVGRADEYTEEFPSFLDVICHPLGKPKSFPAQAFFLSCL